MLPENCLLFLRHNFLQNLRDRSNCHRGELILGAILDRMLQPHDCRIKAKRFRLRLRRHDKAF